MTDEFDMTESQQTGPEVPPRVVSGPVILDWHGLTSGERPVPRTTRSRSSVRILGVADKRGQNFTKVKPSRPQPLSTSAVPPSPHVVGNGERPHLVLHPGLNPIDPGLWALYKNHEPVVDFIKTARLAVLEQVPQEIEAVLEAIERTWSAEGLAVIESSEGKIKRRGKGADGVRDALAAKKALVAKRLTR
jgi:hypothetical protein